MKTAFAYLTFVQVTEGIMKTIAAAQMAAVTTKRGTVSPSSRLWPRRWNTNGGPNFVAASSINSIRMKWSYVASGPSGCKKDACNRNSRVSHRGDPDNRGLHPASFQDYSTAGVSRPTGVSFWFAFGVLLWNWPMMIANAVTFMLTLVIVGMKLYLK